MFEVSFNRLFSPVTAKELNTPFKRYVSTCVHGKDVVGAIHYIGLCDRYRRAQMPLSAYTPLSEAEKVVAQKKIVHSALRAAALIFKNTVAHQLKLLPVTAASATATLGVAALDVYRILPSIIAEPLGNGFVLATLATLVWPTARALMGMTTESVYRVSVQAENLIEKGVRPAGQYWFFKARSAEKNAPSV